MKKIFSYIATLPKRPLRALAVAAVVVIPAAAAIANWGPDRRTYTMATPADHVVFNSIVDNPNFGDERAFLNGKDAAGPNTAGGYQDSIAVKDGQELLIRAYVHNNGAANLNGANFDGPTVAKDARIRMLVPTGKDRNLRVVSYVYAQNADPQIVSDTVDLYSNTEPFTVEYVPGSAVQYNNVTPGGRPVLDAITSDQGTNIGYNANNGVIPGCLQYDAYVVIKVRIKMDTPQTTTFTTTKNVRFEGQTANDWKKEINAQPGDKIEYKVEFKNTGTTTIRNLAIRDQIPAGINYTVGTATLYDSNHPNGYVIPDEFIRSGVVAGDYAPGSNAAVIFKATVKSADQLNCGPNRIINIGVSQPRETSTAISDSAVVNVNRTCVTQFSYSCSALDATSTAIKLGDTVTYTAKVGQLSNTSVTGYVFKVNGVVRQDSTSAVFNYTPATVGTYTVDVQIRVNTPEGVKLTDASQCQKQLKVTEKPKVENPEYNCTAGPAVSFVDNSHNIVRLTMADSSVVARGGAVVKSFVFDYGDGTVPFTTTGKVSEDHRYNDGTYTARVTVNFDVAGQTKSVTNSACTTVVTVKPETPPTTPPTTVTEIPKTGAGDAVAAFFGTSVSAYAVRTWAASRKAVKNAIKR